MRKEDFKEITEGHIKFCEEIIKNKGVCTSDTNCCECPFSFSNAINEESCFPNNYSGSVEVGTEDTKLVNSAQEFLYLAENNIDEKTVGIDFKENDNVNSPNHYRLIVAGHDVEVIDIIKAVLTPEEFRGYLKGNNIKYIMRESNKNHVEDLEKCRNYLDRLIERDKNE